MNNENIYVVLSKCSTIKEFVAAVKSSIRRIGFTDFMLQVDGNAKGISSLKKPVDIEVVMSHCRNNWSSTFLADIPTDSQLRISGILKSKDMINGFNSNGVNDAYLIPRMTPQGDPAAFIIMSAKMDKEQFRKLVKKNIDTLNLLSDAVTYFAVSKFPSFFSVPLSDDLPPKQMKILQLMAKTDITLKTAADQLFISIHTANKHMASAKARLGTDTMAGTIYKAVKMGLIE